MSLLYLQERALHYEALDQVALQGRPRSASTLPWNAGTERGAGIRREMLIAVIEEALRILDEPCDATHPYML